MLFIEEVILLFLFLSFIGTLALIFSAMIRSWQAKTKAKKELRDALFSNSKKRLEDILILYDKELDKETKEKIRIKIDDCLLEEDKEDEKERFESFQ